MACTWAIVICSPCAQETAKETGGQSIALTFDIDPDDIFHPHRLRKLSSNERRLQMLCESGVDAVVALHFTREFASLAPEAFCEGNVQRPCTCAFACGS